MRLGTRPRRTFGPLAIACVATALALAESPPQPPPPQPAPTAGTTAPAPSAPPSPVSGIRNKISAGDLLSAESILEVHETQHGEDGAYLLGLSWLARGALLLGDLDRAKRYAGDVRTRCSDRLRAGADLAKDHDLELALGAAIEVEAQRLERTRGAKPAAAYLRKEIAGLEGPVALVSRLNKRLDMIALAGGPAPELEVEDFVGERPPTLASLRGRPVLLFVWAEGCGDCKAQAAALARVKARHESEGLLVIALTRYYDDPPHESEKERIGSAWKGTFADVGEVPLVISTASMERYGGSSTPTFVFVDRKGVVSWYTPTRLTEAELDRALAAIGR